MNPTTQNYSYVNNAPGSYTNPQLPSSQNTIAAPDPTTAINTAPNIAPTSGVAVNPAPNTTPQPTEYTGAGQQNGQQGQFANGHFTPNTPSSAPNTSAQSELDQNSKDLLAAGKKANDTIDGIRNGSIPLNAGEQAQVDSLQKSLQAVIDQQVLQNKGSEGIANIRGYQKGAAEYDPSFQVKTIGTIVTAGLNKVADMTTKMAGAIAQLTNSLQENDISKIKESYDIYKSAVDDRANILKDTITAAQKAITDANNYALDVAKFNQTGDQNAFENAFKLEQEKFAESNKNSSEAETARHNKATEAIEAFKAGQGAGNGNNIGNGITAAQMGPNGVDPTSQKMTYDQIAQIYGPMTAVAIQGLVDYSRLPTDWRPGATKGMTRDQAVSLAQMLDPTYTEAGAPARQQYMKSLASNTAGSLGSAINSANKSIVHLSAFVGSMNNMGSTWSSKTNSLLNSTVGNLIPGQRQNLEAAKTEGLGVAEELAKFFKGSGTVDVASIDAWKSRIDTNASPADIAGLTQGAITLLGGQLETLAEQYKTVMGKAPDNNLLGPRAMANLSNLKNQGYNIDIPGVIYTDKNAWQTKGGGTQEQWNASVDALTKAGLPLTNENILQYAQSQ